MKILVVGANGQIGQKVVKKLAGNNHEVLAMIRDKSQQDNVAGKNVKPVIADLEQDISSAFKDNLDAVAFTAGSGGHTGPEKTRAIDLQGAKKTIDEAVKNNVRRYIMVSALGTNNAENASEDMRPYFVAKSEADQHLVQSSLDYTILRPGRLTDESGTGQINAGPSIDTGDTVEITRTDVATTIAEVLDKPNTYKKVIEMVNGKTPIPDAVQNI